MAIKIEAKKIIVRGVQMVKVTNIKMLRYNQLPLTYTIVADQSVWYVSEAGLPGRMAYRNSTELIDFNFLVIGEVISPEQWESKKDTITLCGNILQAVNRNLTDENKDWNGEETFTI